MFEFARNNFPDYIPGDIRHGVLRTHPVPITTVSILADRREDAAMETKIQSTDLLPAGVNKSDKDAWDNGILIFDEIAAETLAQDMLRKSKGLDTSKTVRIDPTGTRFEEGYDAIVRQFTKDDEDNSAQLEQFTRELVVAGMTNDRRGLDRISNFLGFESFDSFATSIGREHTYKTEDPKRGRLIYSYHTKGIYGTYPGVISLYFTRESALSLFLSGSALFGVSVESALAPIALGIACVGSILSSYAVVNHVRRVWLHEAAHYFQSGIRNLCLSPIVWRIR
jgi:hypothetical protein